jgi:2,2-dialkylglycine decarboxylase (pyruvate)
VTDVALELGLSANIVRAGASQGVMRIAPPLTVTEAEVDLGVELLGEGVRRVVTTAQLA